MEILVLGAKLVVKLSIIRQHFCSRAHVSVVECSRRRAAAAGAAATASDDTICEGKIGSHAAVSQG